MASPNKAVSSLARVTSGSWQTSDLIWFHSRLREPPPVERSWRTGTPASRMVSRFWRSMNATPSSTARTKCPRPWLKVKPLKTPRAAALAIGL